MNTHSMRELHTMVRSKGSMFDFFNISSAIARVPKLVGPAGGVQVRLGRRASGASCVGMSSQHVSPGGSTGQNLACR
jgi:hypothetical protein